MSLLLGCVADDLTGATDLANMLVREGMRTVQTVGIPEAGLDLPATDAVVVALKSRTIAAAAAVEQSLAALNWLKRSGARQIFFKYCSTFDSTDEGNIGPVAEALLEALGAPLTIACPAFPENGRSVYQGHLFVGSQLLSESGMRDHPLTPMTDSNLVRVLGRQVRGKVGLIPFSTVRQGAHAIRQALDMLRRDGLAFAIVDAVENQHLYDLGAACAELPLVTGGSGAAIGLPANFRGQGLLQDVAAPAALDGIEGKAAVISGSCSQATLGQVGDMKARHPAFAVDPLALAAGHDLVAKACAWAKPRLDDGPVLVYASAPPDQVAAAQAALGRARAGELVEDAMARIARGLVELGVRKLVVAGGETAGAVVQALGIGALRIGPQIDPGVPWTVSVGAPHLALALKSGNFGAPDFFTKALRMLP